MNRYFDVFDIIRLFLYDIEIGHSSMETALVKKVPKVWSTPSLQKKVNNWLSPFFNFSLNRKLVNGNPYYFLISYQLRNEKKIFL